MNRFETIFDMAAGRKGGAKALEALLPKPKSPAALAKIADDRWLSEMTRSVFQAGFNWKVVDAMWPGFEAAFDGFDVGRMTLLSDDDIDRLAADERIVRYRAKIASVRDNAIFVRALSDAHGGAGKGFGCWPSTDYASLLAMMKKDANRLGGTTGQYFLRKMGRDSFVLSRDVVAALTREGVVDKAPTSAAAMKTVQGAFNAWMEESGRGLTHISRVLAMSVG